ncbi:hypothetical protein BDZ45DRAFT_740194 [Acephala macrosclerotiorum]|nr:hypothetical protein BDZ45DRAFT_740194 [Acephala macrosclerotiorum]
MPTAIATRTTRILRRDCGLGQGLEMDQNPHPLSIAGAHIRSYSSSWSLDLTGSKEASGVNEAMLKNFPEALTTNGTEKNLELNYLMERDPWIDGQGRPPTFYHTQQRILYKTAKKGGSFMNLSTALAQGKIRQRINLTKRSHRMEVKDAWAKIAKRERFQEDVLEKAAWGFMSKARKDGRTGYTDTWESSEAIVDELEEEKTVPRTK